jgi:hypothetical protein
MLAAGQNALEPRPAVIQPLSPVSYAETMPLQPAWAEGVANDQAGDWINVEVSAVEYIDRPLMWILRQFDRVLVWLEQGWKWVWQWLRSHL